MAKLHKFVVLALLFALTTTAIHGQTTDEQYDECGSAYTEGSHAAHWSVYIPITILVVAAIWFGVSDRSSHDSNSSDSQDALGSIENAKRNSRDRSGRSYTSNYSQSYGSHCHQ